MSNFAIGCNYWASNAGMYMWREFDAEVVEKDFALLASYGVDTLRVFPLWTDFQPVEQLYVSRKIYMERTDEQPLATYGGLSEKQLQNFSVMLDLAEKYNLKLIVALMTGWMSGRYFCPDIVRHENPLTSAKAIVWETRFISEFVPRFKNRECIVAWEPGNECNVMDGTLPWRGVSRDQAELWLATITNAIRVADNTRPIYAGMHGLVVGGTWDFDMVSHYTDMQTTHPYPAFTPFCDIETITSYRAALHAAAESVYYAGVSNQLCMVEEIGTFNQMLLGDEYTPEYLEKSLFSSFQYAATGYLWWCGFDLKLEFAPYDTTGIERDLGLANDKGEPKPIIKKMKEMKGVVTEIGDLPAFEKDAVVILTTEPDSWKNAYGAFCMAAQAGYSVDFMTKTQAFKKSDFYIIPSLNMDLRLKWLPKLVKEIEDGATLLLTYNSGYFDNFEKLMGLKVRGREAVRKQKPFTLNGKEITIASDVDLHLVANTAEVLATCNGNIMLARNKVGKGYVYFLNGAPENVYTESYLPYESNLNEIYAYVLQDIQKPIRLCSKQCTTTYHRLENGDVAVLVTRFDENTEIAFTLFDKYRIKDTKYCKVKDNKICFESFYAYLMLTK